MHKRFFNALICCVLLLTLLCGAANAVEVEQIQVAMPRVDVYLHADDAAIRALTTDQITATMGGVPMEVESFQRAEQGIFYIFMLDISLSIPTAHLESAKQAVRQACASLRPQDKVALLTFGNSVTVLSDGSESTETVLSKLDALVCTDNNTQFYTAMDTLVEMATGVQDLRRVAVVFSDGVDDTDAGMSQAQLENVLQQSGIAVYAMCIDTASAQSTEQFRSFIKISGGELYTYGGSNAPDVLGQLLDKLDDVWLLQLLSTAQTETTGTVPLHIQLGTLAQVDTQMESAYWIPDATAPYVTGVTMDTDTKTIVVTFSEPVTLGDQIENYVLTDSAGTALQIGGAVYVSADRRSVRLTATQLVATGVYTLKITGLSDLSPNHNPLADYETTLTGSQAGSAAPPSSTQSDAVKDSELAVQKELRGLILSTVGAVVVVGLLILLIVRANKLKGGEGRKQGAAQAAKTASTAKKPSKRTRKW